MHKASAPADIDDLIGDIYQTSGKAGGWRRTVAGRLVLGFQPVPPDASPGEAVALVVLRPLDHPPPLAAAALQAAHGLSAAKAALAVALASGKSLQEHATRRGIAPSTARTQLRLAMAKLGVARQADLVRIVLAGHMPPGIDN